MGRVIDIVDQLKPKVNKPIFEETEGQRKKLAAELRQEAIQKRLDSLVSTFQKTLQKRRKQLKRKNQSLIDSAGNIAILESMLKMTLKILPEAEKQYLLWKNERAAYAIVALVTQAKELSTDIQRLGGAGSSAPVIINTILTPNFQHLLQNVLNENSSLIKILKQQIPKKFHKTMQDSINTAIKNQTMYMSEINHAIAEKVENYYAEK